MILTVGSVNIDHVHRVAALPGPGETVVDTGYARGLGGKGANQSLAARLAGAEVRHAGAIGADGAWCRDRLAAAGIGVEDLTTVEAATGVMTGHAVILVDDRGENLIVVHGGANRALSEAAIERAVGRARAGDWLLLQNETNLVVAAAQAGRAAGLRVAYAAAPFDPAATAAVMPLVDLLAVNAVEAAQLAGHLGRAPERFGAPVLLITEGAEGARCWTAAGEMRQEAFAVEPVDTTGAGDTFLGYFLAGLDRGRPVAEAMRLAAAAAAIQVTRPGAAEAIPTAAEVDAFLAGYKPRGERNFR
jgi:ribokinase